MFGIRAPTPTSRELRAARRTPSPPATLACEAVVLNKGKSIASLEATIHAGNELVSKASGTFAILRRKT